MLKSKVNKVKSEEQVRDECKNKTSAELFEEIKQYNLGKNKIEKSITRDIVLTLGVVTATVALSADTLLTMDITATDFEWNANMLGILGCGVANLVMIAKMLYDQDKFHKNKAKQPEYNTKLEIALQKFELEK